MHLKFISQESDVRTRYFDAYLEPFLISREPRLRAYVDKLSEFRHWVLTEVDAQANYTDRYAPPALETYDPAAPLPIASW